MRGLIDTVESLITPPSVEPLDLTEVKKQRRFQSSSIDTLFALWIAAARQHFEEQTGRQVITATWQYALDCFPNCRQIELPRPPLQSVQAVETLQADGSWSQFLDESGSPTVTPYEVIAPLGSHAARGRIVLKPGYSWPTPASRAKAVRITFIAGYGDAPSAVPDLLQYALMMLVGHFHKFGEEVQDAKSSLMQLPLGAKMILEAYKFSAKPQLLPRIGFASALADWSDEWIWR